MKKLLLGLTLLLSMPTFSAEMITSFSGEYTGVDEKGYTCIVSLKTYSNAFVNGENNTDMKIQFNGEKSMEISLWIRKI